MRNKKLNIYKRKDGRYEGRVYLTEYNFPKYKSFYGKTHKVAAEKVLEYLKEREKGDINVRCKRYFNELLDEWMKAINVKESTICCYRTKIDNHIRPFFKGLKYDAVDALKIQCFIGNLTEKGLGSKYINDIISIVKSFAKWVKKTYHCENKVSEVSVPKVVHNHNKVELLGIKEQTCLCKYIKSHTDNYNIGIYIAINTGIRIGELCALTWRDVDLEKKILHITKSVQRLTDNNSKRRTTVKVTSPKTASSIRDIPISDYLVDFLKPFAADNEIYILSGSTKVIESRTMSYAFKRTLKKANVPSVRFHSLRHSFATNCLQAGFDIKTLSEILGHASISTTMKVYVHSSMERKAECMSRLKPAA